MSVREVCEAIKTTRKEEDFLMKIYEGNDSSFLKSISSSMISDDMLNRQVKSFCISNNEKQKTIKHLTIILV